MPKKNPSLTRNRNYTFRMSELEYEMVRYKAFLTGIKMSEFVRRSALTKPLPKRVSKVDLKTYVELGRIGNNLNQLSKAVNTALKYSVTPPSDRGKLQELLELLHSIRRQIAAADSEEDLEEELDDWEAD